MRIKPSFLLLLVFASGLLGIVAPPAEAQDIEYCEEETYADCTEAAHCTEKSAEIAECKCDVKSADSVTTGGCTTPEGGLQSRYPGVPLMGVCTSETKRWADCLGVDCGPEDHGKSKCQCKIATSPEALSEQFVIVGRPWDQAQQFCTEDLQSSATPGQVFQATTVLRQGREEAGGSGEVTKDPAISWSYWNSTND